MRHAIAIVVDEPNTVFFLFFFLQVRVGGDGDYMVAIYTYVASF